jgi:hypothetical protein
MGGVMTSSTKTGVGRIVRMCGRRGALLVRCLRSVALRFDPHLVRAWHAPRFSARQRPARRAFLTGFAAPCTTLVRRSIVCIFDKRRVPLAAFTPFLALRRTGVCLK